MKIFSIYYLSRRRWAQVSPAGEQPPAAGVTFFIAKKVTKKGDPRREAPPLQQVAN